MVGGAHFQLFPISLEWQCFGHLSCSATNDVSLLISLPPPPCCFLTFLEHLEQNLVFSSFKSLLCVHCLFSAWDPSNGMGIPAGHMARKPGIESKSGAVLSSEGEALFHGLPTELGRFTQAGNIDLPFPVQFSSACFW